MGVYVKKAGVVVPAATVKGQAGPQGAQGAQGPAGALGPQGIPGVNSFVTYDSANNVWPSRPSVLYSVIAVGGPAAPSWLTDTDFWIDLNGTGGTQYYAPLDGTTQTVPEMYLPAYLRRASKFECVPMYVFGSTYVKGGAGSDDGSRYWDRVASRFNVLAETNYGASQKRIDQIIPQVTDNWKWGQRGLVGLGDLLIDYVRQFASTATAHVNTAKECFRSILAHLYAQDFKDFATGQLTFGPGWTNGVSDGSAGRYVDIGFNGDTAYVVCLFAGSGGTVTVKDTAGNTLATQNTGAFFDGQVPNSASYPGFVVAPWRGVVKISGQGSGDHTVRLTTSGAACTVVGVLAQNPNPPQVAWFKPGPYINGGSTQQGQLATYQTALATVLTDFPEVVPVDVDSHWDNGTMLATNGVTLNDQGNAYVADLIEDRLLNAVPSFRQGLHQLTADRPAYTPPVPVFNPAAATAPVAPSSVSSAAGAQATVTWQRNDDGGATITGHTVQSSPDGTTWTTVGTAGPEDTTYVVRSGLVVGNAYYFRVGATNYKGTTYSGSTASTVSAGNAQATVAKDSYDRTDSASLGSTPTGAFAWSNYNGATSAIENNRLRIDVPTGGAVAGVLVDPGQANGTASFRVVSGKGVSLGVVARHNGTAGLLVWHGSDNYWRVSRITSAGVLSTLVNPATVQATDNDLVQVVMNGTTVTVYINGSSFYSFTDSTSNTYTKCGFIKSVAGTFKNFDDFEFTDALVI